MAEDLGKRLMSEVAECGLDELLHTLRLIRDVESTYFDLPPLDALLTAAVEARQARHATQSKTQEAQPIVELTSLHVGGGATHILYYLTTLAILPPRNATVALIDADNTFSVTRLARMIRDHVSRHSEQDSDSADADAMLLSALKHVHIFRPQSLASLTATIRSLPAYLFNATEHFSFDRQVAFMAIDSVSAFMWQDKSAAEDAALQSSPGSKAPSATSGYSDLAAALKETSTTLHCPVLVTSWHLGPPPPSTVTHGPSSRSFRPAISAPWSTLPTLRLVVQRVPVRKFPSAISVDTALREAEDRLKAVEEGKIECFVNEWGVDERTLQKLHQVGSGFGFRINEQGLAIEG